MESPKFLISVPPRGGLIQRLMEEEHRRIVREALLGKAVKRPSFKDALLAMPDVGDDADFERGAQIGRPVEL